MYWKMLEQRIECIISKIAKKNYIGVVREEEKNLSHSVRCFSMKKTHWMGGNVILFGVFFCVMYKQANSEGKNISISFIIFSFFFFYNQISLWITSIFIVHCARYSKMHISMQKTQKPRSHLKHKMHILSSIISCIILCVHLSFSLAPSFI